MFGAGPAASTPATKAAWPENIAASNSSSTVNTQAVARSQRGRGRPSAVLGLEVTRGEQAQASQRPDGRGGTLFEGRRAQVRPDLASNRPAGWSG